MLKTDLILRNPIQYLGGQSEDVLASGQFGGVLARAGVGKTALMVQIALNSMLHERNVLHVSLNQPVNKTNLWYREVFGHVARQFNVPQPESLWESLLPHRFIMTFRTEGFSVPKLEERLTDLVEQKIFVPRMLIVDGLSFDEPLRDSLAGLKHYRPSQRPERMVHHPDPPARGPGTGRHPQTAGRRGGSLRPGAATRAGRRGDSRQGRKRPDPAGGTCPPGARPLDHAGEGPRRVIAGGSNDFNERPAAGGRPFSRDVSIVEV